MHPIIITCDAFKSTIVSSVDLFSFDTFQWSDFFIFGSINENNSEYFLGIWFCKIKCRSDRVIKVLIKESR